jgi:AraC-like DNA-binding protein
MDINDSAAHAVAINSVQKIIDYIEENIAEPLAPASIAKEFFLSVSSINILFRVVCDIALMEYIRNRRLTLAGLELLQSNVRIIDLAYKYGYETPEAFAKAFSRYHGFPPSFVRRVYPEIKMFSPLQIKVDRQGGWSGIQATGAPLRNTTELKSLRQEKYQDDSYTDLTKPKGEINMKSAAKTHDIFTKGMEQKDDWKVLLSLAKKLETKGIPFKVDGGTMIFAHGLDFKLDKICLTFMWNDEQRILDFFGYRGTADKSFQSGFWYFDAMFDGMKIRCMSYGDCHPDNNTIDFLYRNTDLVNADGQMLRVQTVEFYLENAEPKDSEFYQMVSQWAKGREQAE